MHVLPLTNTSIHLILFENKMVKIIIFQENNTFERPYKTMRNRPNLSFLFNPISLFFLFNLYMSSVISVRRGARDCLLIFFYKVIFFSLSGHLQRK